MVKPKEKWLYQAKVNRVKDADTLCVDIDLTSLSLLHKESPNTELIDLGFSFFLSVDFLPLIFAGSAVWRKDESIRLFGLNAPEKNTEAGKVSLAFVNTLLPVGTIITLETIRLKSRTKQEKYGRYLGRVLLPDGRCVNNLLVSQGFAVQV